MGRPTLKGVGSKVDVFLEGLSIAFKTFDDEIDYICVFFFIISSYDTFLFSYKCGVKIKSFTLISHKYL